MICDARNWNLFLTEFMLICAKMGRLRFFSFNDFRLIFSRLFFSLSLSIWLSDRLDFLLQIGSSPSSAVLAYISFFQKFLIISTKFIAKRRDPDSFKCKPLRLKCLLIFLLWTMSIFNCSRWLVNWFYSKHYLLIIWTQCWFQNNTLQSGNFSCISDLKFRSLFNISVDVEWYVSLVPAWTIWLGFFWSNGIMWWFKSSMVAPGKFLTLTLHTLTHNASCKTPLMIESPSINFMLFGHCPFSVVIFSLAVLLWKLF